MKIIWIKLKPNILFVTAKIIVLQTQYRQQYILLTAIEYLVLHKHQNHPFCEQIVSKLSTRHVMIRYNFISSFCNKIYHLYFSQMQKKLFENLYF